MPHRPSRPCRIPGCPELLAPGAQCPRPGHSRDEGPFAEFYRSEAWRRLSMTVRIEEPICRVPGCGRPTEQADHIVSMTDGGAPLARENVQGLCGPHHRAKTKADRAARASLSTRGARHG